MTAFVTDHDLAELSRNSAQTGRVVLVVTPPTGSTVSQAIVKTLKEASYHVVESEPVPKSNIFDTKYSRQREWWNTPKKERRRKK